MENVLAWGLVIAFAGGLIRGTTGFGASMVMKFCFQIYLIYFFLIIFFYI